MYTTAYKCPHTTAAEDVSRLEHIYIYICMYAYIYSTIYVFYIYINDRIYILLYRWVLAVEVRHEHVRVVRHTYCGRRTKKKQIKPGARAASERVRSAHTCIHESCEHMSAYVSIRLCV